MTNEVSGDQPTLPGVPTSKPARYRQLSEPFESAEAIDVALEGFHREMGELRAKYKFPDVYVIVAANGLTAEGVEGAFTTTLHFGSDEHAEPLTAYAYGLESARRQERIAKMLAKSMKLRAGSK